MSEILLIAGSGLVPLAFGLVPGFLPPSVPLFVRWALWVAVLAATIAYIAILSAAPPPLQTVTFVSSSLAMALSLAVLVAETRRANRTQRTNP